MVADHYRVRSVPTESNGVEVADSASEAPDEGNLNELVAGWLRPMVALLPDEYREAVELVDIVGLGQREYAERVGLSLSGAESRVQRGRRMLEELVRGCCDIELDARGNVIGYQRRHCGPDCRGC